MSIKSQITDGTGSGNLVKVTSRNELVVGAAEFSTAYAVSVTATATAYNFVPPIADKNFIVTDVLLYADKNVGATDASVQLYEASSATSTTEDKTILSIDMVKQTSRDLVGLNLLVSEGKWLNIKTNDNNIYATVMGYYIGI